MLRSLPRVTKSASLFSRPLPRSSHLPQPIAVITSSIQQRFLTPHAISNPTLASIEKRWEAMPPQEQADLWMALRDRMRTDWHELTMQEKKAGRSSRHCSIVYSANKRYSILDCFRSPRSSGYDPTRWRVESICIHHGGRCSLLRSLPSHSVTGRSSADDYEQGMARGYQWILEGT